MTIRAVLTDIEGTTSSIAFVTEVLFPYASQQMPVYVRENCKQTEIRILLEDVRKEAAEADADVDRVIDILLQWISEDRKATPLKTLQGHIWKHGYENGDFKGHVFEDAVRNLRLWHRAGIEIFVYSSGSVAAQKLLFGYSDLGDLNELFNGYFDTTTGHKRERRSYESIAEQTGVAAADILFLSDIVEELDAAKLAGMQTIQLVRDNDGVRGSHQVARDFDEIRMEGLA